MKKVSFFIVWSILWGALGFSLSSGGINFHSSLFWIILCDVIIISEISKINPFSGRSEIKH